ncbi:MAG: cation transporter [Bacteroidetes bacterium]|nr:cation transporter [Bacteroidota bacterium]MCH8524922.1 cation diffusion facilitator family transporter [Balneolales bacterium]
MVNNAVKNAIRISFAVSIVSFLIKFFGYLLTGSNAVLSDMAESVVHMLAVGFSMYGVYLSMKPPDEKHPYGHERIEFLSVGVEGSVIIIAGITIIYQSIRHLVLGLEPENLEQGIMVIAAAGVINLALGSYLMYVGKANKNNIIIGNAKHTLTDVWTSGGVIVTLILIKWTNFTLLDSIVAILVATYIMYEGYNLVRFAYRGIMDERDEEQDRCIRYVLNNDMPEKIKGWHGLRHRRAGRTTWIELHVLFDKDIRLEEAHDIGTELERRIMTSVDGDAVVTLHLEPEQTHAIAHKKLKGTYENDAIDKMM